jgi:hypothetical protein
VGPLPLKKRSKTSALCKASVIINETYTSGIEVSGGLSFLIVSWYSSVPAESMPENRQRPHSLLSFTNRRSNFALQLDSMKLPLSYYTKNCINPQYAKLLRSNQSPQISEDVNKHPYHVIQLQCLETWHTSIASIFQTKHQHSLYPTTRTFYCSTCMRLT